MHKIIFLFSSIVLGMTFCNAEETVNIFGKAATCKFWEKSCSCYVPSERHRGEWELKSVLRFGAHTVTAKEDNSGCSSFDYRICAERAYKNFRDNKTPEELADPDISTTIYPCPNQQRILVREKYGDTNYILERYSSRGDVFLHFNINDGNGTTPVHITNENNLFDFFCNFDFKKFTKTHKFETDSLDVSLFSTPNKQAVVPSTPKAQTYPIENRKDTTFLNEKFFLMPLQTSSLNSGIRIFQNKEKNKELRVIFSSTDKNSFLTKLQTEHREHLNSQTTCPNGNILFEIFNDGVYEAFLLDKQAIVVLAESYSTQPEDLFNKKKQELLCQTNPISFY